MAANPLCKDCGGRGGYWWTVGCSFQEYAACQCKTAPTAKTVYKSHAQWPLDVYKGMDGKGISTDSHDTQAGAMAVCEALKRDGFGGQGVAYPVRTWITLETTPCQSK